MNNVPRPWPAFLQRLRFDLSRPGFSLHHLCAFAAAALVVSTTSLQAQESTGTINGRVLNIGNNRYLNNAKVSVEGTNLVTYTNQYGDYVLPNVPAGPVQLRASYTGLDEESATVNVTAGSATTHNFELTSRARYGEDKALVLDAFVVESQREYEGDALATNEQRHAPNIKVVMSSDSFGTINEGNPG